MFSGLLEVLNLQDNEDQRQVNNPGQATGSQLDKPSSSTSDNSGPGFSFWNVANVVTSTVKQQANDLVKAVQQTDWKAELSTFGQEVSKDTKELSAKTVSMVDNLPHMIEHLPEQVERAAPVVVEGGKEVGHKLEEVGASIFRFGGSLFNGTKELLEQVRDAVETEMAAVSKEQKRGSRGARGAAAAKYATTSAVYSRFEQEVSAMQRNSSTYCDEPEDAADFASWRSGFSLESMRAEVERISRENAFMAELQARIVPLIVEYDDFWSRYFYRLHKLQQKEEQRRQLTERAKADDGEQLAWDDASDEDETPAVAATQAQLKAAPAPLNEQPQRATGPAANAASPETSPAKQQETSPAATSATGPAPPSDTVPPAEASTAAPDHALVALPSISESIAAAAVSEAASVAGAAAPGAVHAEVESSSPGGSQGGFEVGVLDSHASSKTDWSMVSEPSAVTPPTTPPAELAKIPEAQEVSPGPSEPPTAASGQPSIPAPAQQLPASQPGSAEKPLAATEKPARVASDGLDDDLDDDLDLDLEGLPEGDDDLDEDWSNWGNDNEGEGETTPKAGKA